HAWHARRPVRDDDPPHPDAGPPPQQTPPPLDRAEPEVVGQPLGQPAAVLVARDLCRVDHRDRDLTDGRAPFAEVDLLAPVIRWLHEVRRFVRRVRAHLPCDGLAVVLVDGELNRAVGGRWRRRTQGIEYEDSRLRYLDLLRPRVEYEDSRLRDRDLLRPRVED